MKDVTGALQVDVYLFLIALMKETIKIKRHHTLGTCISKNDFDESLVIKRNCV